MLNETCSNKILFGQTFNNLIVETTKMCQTLSLMINLNKMLIKIKLSSMPKNLHVTKYQVN